MSAARIKSLEFVGRDQAARPESATAGLKAGLEDGGQSSFSVATPDQPARWLDKGDFAFGSPVLFVRRLDESTVATAVQAMAGEMGGYWLRYFNSPGEPAPKAKTAKRRGKR